MAGLCSELSLWLLYEKLKIKTRVRHIPWEAVTVPVKSNDGLDFSGAMEEKKR